VSLIEHVHLGRRPDQDQGFGGLVLHAAGADAAALERARAELSSDVRLVPTSLVIG
jgi:hypothetical protein